jgi:hypothetical protein
MYEITETATKPVQSPNDESVTFTQRFQASLKFRPNGRLAASMFLVDLSALRTLKSVDMRIGYARVSTDIAARRLFGLRRIPL